ncbi:MAG: diguanylate cyclase [Anaerolineales bacterium]|nr:diguanylate cyclase [Anaerolineales bacterium]MBX3038487.1 diguanylate cyclase [Anaerolineales bacterium]
MSEDLHDSQTQIDIFAKLGKDLASTTHAETAARIILDAADQLIGWDACYLILYDPQRGGKPRPLLTIDTIEGRHVVQKGAAPDKPSENMLKAIQQGGFLSLYDEHFEIAPALSFGDYKKRTLSQLFVPVVSGARIIGVLSIQSYQVKAYQNEQLDLLNNLASHCAGALERIWAQEALTDLVERLKILHQAVSDVNASLDVERVCQVVYETVIKVMSCDDFVVDGYDSKTNEIIPIFAIEHPGRRVYTKKYFADHGLAGEIVRTKKPILFNSIQEMNQSDIHFEFYGSQVDDDPTESILAVPMMLHGQIYGMISAQSYQQNVYNHDDQYLLEMLASHVAIAIENARLFDSVQQAAYTDALTSTLNRRRFYELSEIEFERTKQSKQPLAIVMLDVDDFKKFNDQYGHKVGDFVLMKIAETCKSSLRGNDIFGRLGGEEFALTLPNTKLEYALEIATRLCKLIQQLDCNQAAQHFDKDLFQNNYQLTVTVSIGVAVYDETCKNLDTLIDRADQAMYLAKNSGRNQVHVWGS